MITTENEIARFFERLGLNIKIHKPDMVGTKLSRMMHNVEILPGGKIEMGRERMLLQYYFRTVRGTELRPKIFLDEFKPEGHGVLGICKRCGCTENDACTDPDTGTCYWVLEDLCSACCTSVEKYQAIEAMAKRIGGSKV